MSAKRLGWNGELVHQLEQIRRPVGVEPLRADGDAASLVPIELQCGHPSTVAGWPGSPRGARREDEFSPIAAVPGLDVNALSNNL